MAPTMNSNSLLPILGLVSVLFASSAWAQTEAVSNLGQARNGGLNVTTSFYEAGRFTTGTSASGSVGLFSVAILANSPSSNPGTGFALNLYSDNANPNGGTLIATLTGSDPTGDAYSTYTFSSPPGILLADNTSYWLVASAGSAGAFQWGETSSDTETGLPGWSISNDHWVSVNSGVDWFTTLNQAPMFAVNIAPVPEPSTYAAGVMLAGAVGGLWWRRRAR